MAVNKVVLGSETLIDLTEDTATAEDVAAGATLHLSNGLRATGTASYAGAPENNGNANKANSILFGAVDSTSTATVFTATVEGLEELTDGTCVMLKNGVVTSASGFTLNVNGLGAKPVYNNLAAATRDTTIFNVAYTMLFVYDSTRVSGGAWICYRGYDANTNTIGYQLRTNSTVRNVSDTARYYKLYFTSADGTMWVPASVNSTNNATSARPVNQRPIDPFGPIVYTSANTNYAAGANLAAGTIWEQYALVLGYSFNRTGEALALTVEAPVYVKCAPQTDGSAIMDADEPIVQALPSTKDGKIYIYLGIAYDATHIELQIWHPVYWHDGTGIRLWTGSEGGADITVDSSLSSTSENPVQNKVINTALGTKLSGITFGTSGDTYVVPVSNGTAQINVGDGLKMSDAYDTATISAKIGTASGTVAAGDHTHNQYQPTLVSGTNIKTVNGNSLLGSGDVTISAPTYTTQAVSIPASAWSNGAATVNVSAVTSTSDVIVAPTPASMSAWASAGVYCSAQGAGTLTFTCATAPTEALTANVMAFEGGGRTSGA